MFVSLQVKARILDWNSRPSAFFNKMRNWLRDHELVCRPADKNLGLAVVPFDDLHIRETRHLGGSNFQLVSLNQRLDQAPLEERAKALADLFTKKLKSNQRVFTFSKKLFFLPSKPKLPRFYGMPKLHKTPWAIRPIIAAHSWITTPASKAVFRITQNWLEQLDALGLSHVVSSTDDFLNRLELWIRPLDDISKTTLLGATADFTDLYSNLQRADIISAVKKAGVFLRFPQLDDFLHLVELVLDFSYFTWDGKLFLQKEGIPMGTNCGPSLANLTLLAMFTKSNFNPGLPTKSILLLRFIDDVFFLTSTRGSNISHQVFTHLASRWTSNQLELNWDYATGNLDQKSRPLIYNDNPVCYTLHFLDVEFDLRTLHTSLYRKPTFSWMYVHASSKHPKSAQQAWIVNEIRRIYKICNNPIAFYSEYHLLRSALLRLGHRIPRSPPSWSTSSRNCLLGSRKVSKTGFHWIPWPLELHGDLRSIVTEIIRKEPSWSLFLNSVREATTLSPSLARVLD
jgi:hypothetical protein